MVLGKQVYLQQNNAGEKVIGVPMVNLNMKAK